MMISRIIFYYLWQVPSTAPSTYCVRPEHPPCSCSHPLIWEQMLHVLLISCLLVKVVCLGLFLVSLFPDLHFAHVGCDKCVLTMNMFIRWPQFMGRTKLLSKCQGFFSHLLLRNLGNQESIQKWEGHGWIVLLFLSLSNLHWNHGGHFEILDTEVWRYEIVRGCQK